MAAFCAPFIRGTDANRTVKDQLTALLMRPSVRRRISVTDLISPRQAYFGRLHPEIQPTLDRQQAMLAGTGLHESFGRAVSTEEFVEQLVEYKGIVGKIDIYEDVPIELKTTSAIPSSVFARPANLEQLAMYCAMTGKSGGHLLFFKRAEYGRPPVLRAFRVEFSGLDSVDNEMIRRRNLLQHALAVASPDGLPRCDWFGRDCSYGEICGCEAAASCGRMVTPETTRVHEDKDLPERLLENVTPFDLGQGLILHDLVWPRRAAFRRQAPVEAEEETKEERMTFLQRAGFEDALKETIWYGIPGASRRMKVRLGPILAKVLVFQDIPTLIRNNRGAREMFHRNRLAEETPHYLDRLAFECALVGSERGRLVIYYSTIPDDKFMVYDIWFRDVNAIRSEMERRLTLLEMGADPNALPACEPAWAAKFCEFNSRCGCASKAE